MLRRWVDHYAARGRRGAPRGDRRQQRRRLHRRPALPGAADPALRKQGFEPARMGLLGGISAGLLEAYDAVMFCDADEFVVADPRTHESLRHFVAARPGPRRRSGCMGLNVVHDVRREEPPLRDGEPILGQRRLAKFLPLMCKPAPEVGSRPTGRTPRTASSARSRSTRELFMFHMKFADRDHLAEVAAHRHHLNTDRGPGGEDQLGAVGRRDGRAARRDHHRPRPRPDRAVRGEGARPEEDRPAPRRHVAGHRRRPGHAMRNRPMVRVPDRFVGGSSCDAPSVDERGIVVGRPDDEILDVLLRRAPDLVVPWRQGRRADRRSLAASPWPRDLLALPRRRLTGDRAGRVRHRAGRGGGPVRRLRGPGQRRRPRRACRW